MRQRYIPIIVSCHRQSPKPSTYGASGDRRPSAASGSHLSRDPEAGSGLLNIRSFSSKFENIPDLFDEHTLSFLALTETWHEDFDSVTIRRLQSFGYTSWNSRALFLR